MQILYTWYSETFGIPSFLPSVRDKWEPVKIYPCDGHFGNKYLLSKEFLLHDSSLFY